MKTLKESLLDNDFDVKIADTEFDSALVKYFDDVKFNEPSQRGYGGVFTPRRSYHAITVKDNTINLCEGIYNLAKNNGLKPISFSTASSGKCALRFIVGEKGKKIKGPFYCSVDNWKTKEHIEVFPDKIIPDSFHTDRVSFIPEQHKIECFRIPEATYNLFKILLNI